MQAVLGVIFHFIGGFASGSFYMPYKKVKGWHWESFWIVGGIFSWFIVPPLAAYLTIPGFTDIIKQASSSTIGIAYLFGVLWGIGGLTYGLGVRYLGVSLGSSIILGLCMVFGALIPSVYYNVFPKEGKDNFSMLIGSTWGLTVMAGLALCVVGIIICGKAGVMKEKQLSAGNQQLIRMEWKRKQNINLAWECSFPLYRVCLVPALILGWKQVSQWQIWLTKYGKLPIPGRVIFCTRIM